MVLKHNMSALRTLNTLNKNDKALAKSLKKVSSGMKINSAADDASAYSISEKMRVQIRSLDQANANAQNATSMLRTAEGAASSTMDILKTMKEKAIDAANDTNTDSDRATIQKQLDQCIDQISDNSNVTFNGMQLFSAKSDISTSTQDTIIKALSSEWIETSLNMISEAYGISFQSDSAGAKDMVVKFKNDASSTALAYVSYDEYSSGEATNISLNINMHYYNNMDENDPNGSTTTAGAGYLDRTIAHEMVHAVMASNINKSSAIPSYICEGLSETIHGIDDTRRSKLRALTTGTINDGFGASPSSDNAYTVGYAFCRYLNARSGMPPGTSLKNMISTYVNQGGAANDAAIKAASNGKFTTEAEAKASFLADFTAAGSAEKFLLNYCNIDLNNEDTGSALGSDYRTGDTKTAESVVLEGMSTKFWSFPTSTKTEINGLTVDWQSFTKDTDGFKFQIGDKANQSINVILGNISAEGLGLRDSKGETLSVATRAKATDAITILDRAVSKVLDQLTNIGAVESRLEYTQANLTTVSTNTTDAESTLRDSDMAKEMTEYTKNNVLLQASQSMLAQANQNSSNVLSLLQ